MDLSISIVVNVNHLSVEYTKLLNECSKLRPNNVIINSSETDVVTHYKMYYYDRYHLTNYVYINSKLLTDFMFSTSF